MHACILACPIWSAAISGSSLFTSSDDTQVRQAQVTAHALHSTYLLHISLHTSWIMVMKMTTALSLGATPKQYAGATPKHMPMKVATPKRMPRQQKERPSVKPVSKAYLFTKPTHYAGATPKHMPMKVATSKRMPTQQKERPSEPTQQRARLESEQLAMKREDAESWLYYLDCLEGKAMKRTQKSMSSHEEFKPSSPFHEEFKLSFHEETDSQPGFGQYPPDNNELIDEINGHHLMHEDPKKSMLTKKRSQIGGAMNHQAKKRRSQR